MISTGYPSDSDPLAELPTCPECGIWLTQDLFDCLMTGSAKTATLKRTRMKNPPKIQVAIAVLSIIALALSLILDRE